MAALVVCPNECAMAKLKSRVEGLRDRLCQPAEQDCITVNKCRHRQLDPCCDNSTKVKDKKQLYKVTVNGEIVGPLWPEITKRQVPCPPCKEKRPEMHPSLACYNPCNRIRKSLPGGNVYRPRDFGCPSRNAYSVCRAKTCPTGHNHWYPECTDCKYPNSCRADCLTHPTYKDWIYRQPSYRFYLQNGNYKPFRPGF